MTFEETNLYGCYCITPEILRDDRGTFVKTFHHDLFVEKKLAVDFREEYFTYSIKNVLRGMHFQVPPQDHEKLVYCILGSALDAVVDLRQNSPTFGRSVSIELSDKNSRIIYIPKGMAHGFYVTGDNALMVYKVTTMYDPACDAGVRWDSCGISWPSKNPILSKRDQLFPSLDNFNNPFSI